MGIIKAPPGLGSPHTSSESIYLSTFPPRVDTGQRGRTPRFLRTQVRCTQVQSLALPSKNLVTLSKSFLLKPLPLYCEEPLESPLSTYPGLLPHTGQACKVLSASLFFFFFFSSEQVLMGGPLAPQLMGHPHCRTLASLAQLTWGSDPPQVGMDPTLHRWENRDPERAASEVPPAPVPTEHSRAGTRPLRHLSGMLIITIARGQCPELPGALNDSRK